MKIGLMSDTHNNIKYTTMVARYLIVTHEVDKIYHLGDECEDVLHIKKEGIDVVSIPGVLAKEYEDPSIPNQITEKIDGIKIILTHDIADISSIDIVSHDVILFAHSHNYELRCELSKLFINPGHLKEEFHKGRIATFGVMSIDQNVVKAEIYDINFKIVASIMMSKRSS